jgi:hypothetical protein
MPGNLEFAIHTLVETRLDTSGLEEKYHNDETGFFRLMAGKVDSELGRKIYHQWFAVAEPIFANLRTHKRLDRFTLRGKVTFIQFVGLARVGWDGKEGLSSGV